MSRHRFARRALFVTLWTVSSGLLVITAGTARAAGQQPDAAKKSVWDAGTYTNEQAARGGTTFASTCAQCHGVNLEGRNAKPLVGEPFQVKYQQRSLDYLLNYVSKNMPNNAPGTLDPTTYQDLVAFILSKNEMPAGGEPLTPATAKGFEIIPKGGLKPLPEKTPAGVVGCLAKGGASGWTLNMATTPVRVDNSAIPPTAATEPLGDRTIPLLFVISRLDSSIGKRVWVRGLLVGEGGSNGINVSEVRAIADTCQ